MTTPRVVVAPIESALRITAMNDAAARLGLKPGMALADARAMYPSLAGGRGRCGSRPRACSKPIADWCDRYTPLVGLDPPDGLLLDITGCAHLFGGEAALGRDLVARLAQQGFARARGGRRHAWAAPGASRAMASTGIVPRGETRSGDAAAADRGAAHRCRRPSPRWRDLGLKRVADLAARPRAPFAARFGEGLLRRLDQALGRVDEPITPRLPVPAAMAEQRFPDPIAREEDVLGTIEHLAHELAACWSGAARARGCCRSRCSAPTARCTGSRSAPARRCAIRARVRKLFEDRLAVLGDACDPGFGFDMIRLSALVTERLDPVQTGLAGGRSRARSWRI